MKVALAVLLAVVAIASVNAGERATCQDGTPTPTPTPTTPAPTTPTPSTSTPTSCLPTTPGLTIPPRPTTPAPTTPAPTSSLPTTPGLTIPPRPTTPAPTTPEPMTPVPTSPPVCSPVLKDTHYYDGYATFKNGVDASGCCVLCAKTAGCKAFNHKPDPDICWIRYDADTFTPVPMANATSGVVTSPKKCDYQPAGTKLLGEDYNGYDFHGVKLCCVLCSLDGPKCKGFSYDTLNHFCHLKASITGTEMAEGWTSGYNK